MAAVMGTVVWVSNVLQVYGLLELEGAHVLTRTTGNDYGRRVVVRLGMSRRT